jgi:hypothetical protein
MASEDAEPKYVFKPGYRVEAQGVKGVVTIQIFEQLANNQYIYAVATKKLPGEPHETYDESIQHTVGMPEGNCAPIDKAPWALVEKPLPSGSESELWAEVKQFVYDHLFLPDAALYDVLTSWVFASWIPEAWSVVPYVFFYGPVASGKTRGLEVLHRLSYRAILSSNISSAALFRAAEAWKPTLILDETEIYNRQEKIEVIGLLNSGYRRGQFAIRVKTSEEGELLECFDVFGFKALAGTEGLAKALESRSIMIRMLKNRRRVNLHIDEKKAEELRAKLLSWRFQVLTSGELREVCEGFTERIGQLDFDSGRLEELFQCLLAVSNDGRENILKYAEKMAEVRQFEEMTSYEADVVEAMTDESLEVENCIILTKDITERLNANRLEKERLKTSHVGWIIRRLGFEPRHTRRGNGWHYDKERIAYLKAIYLTDATAKKGSQGSQGSRPMDVDGMGSVNTVKDVNLLLQPTPDLPKDPYFNACFFCQKPIWTDDAVFNLFTENKPAHKECWEAQQATMMK